MPERSANAPARPASPDLPRDLPSPEIAAFIRYCHRRRPVGWPEIYDEMCGVAARQEFNGWGHDQLAARGVTFALPEMPRLASWVRAVLAEPADPRLGAIAQAAGI
jgi:hypothetical protein